MSYDAPTDGRRAGEVTIRQAAELLGRSYDEVRDMIDIGDLPGRYDPDDDRTYVSRAAVDCERRIDAYLAEVFQSK